ncbi:Uncharacterised protein [Vibrio cholerae]|nr:Uncharacterised protein [Vibrio cholerae]
MLNCTSFILSKASAREGSVDHTIELICGSDMGRKANGPWAVKIWRATLLCGSLVRTLATKALCP